MAAEHLSISHLKEFALDFLSIHEREVRLLRSNNGRSRENSGTKTRFPLLH